MADNYLEKRMEDLRSGRIGVSSKGTSSFHTSGRTKPGLRAFIANATGDAGADMVKDFRNRGWKVAFASADRKEGTALAQATGARFYPVDDFDTASINRCKADLSLVWGGIDIFVEIAPGVG